jgi:predicted enzyme related to lactoylglutathione lyase
MPNPVVHFEIGGPDRGALAAFYERVFSWDIQDVPEMDYSLVHTKDGDAGIDGGFPVQHGPWTCVYIEVPDPQGSLDAAVAAGADVVMPVIESPGLTLARFRDPAGNVVGLVKSEESART